MEAANLENVLQQLSHNDGELFVDDSSVYRAIIHKTVEGNLTTRPINGAIFLFQPLTGQFSIKIMLPSNWAGQQRVGEFAKLKAAEGVAELVRSLPLEKRPKQINVTSNGLLNPLKTTLLDFPDIEIKATELQLPFFACLNVEKFKDLIDQATEPETVVFNLYDDWLESISPSDAFCRLVLILKALRFSKDQTTGILKPDASIFIEPDRVWPTHTGVEWTEVEAQLKNLIPLDEID